MIRFDKGQAIIPGLDEMLDTLEQQFQAGLASIAAIRQAAEEARALPDAEEALEAFGAISETARPSLGHLWQLREQLASEYRIEISYTANAIAYQFGNLRYRFLQLQEARLAEERAAAARERRAQRFANYEAELARWREACRRGDAVGPEPQLPKD